MDSSGPKDLIEAAKNKNVFFTCEDEDSCASIYFEDNDGSFVVLELDTEDKVVTLLQDDSINIGDCLKVSLMFEIANLILTGVLTINEKNELVEVPK